MRFSHGNSYPDFMRLSVADAKNRLPDLIKAVERVEPSICSLGVPIVDYPGGGMIV
jgi:hypothetical protein